MPRRDPSVTLREMLDAARKARWVFETHHRAELDDDWESAYALRLSLQILGEAAGRLPADWRDQHPGIPWGEVVGLRHVLFHWGERGQVSINAVLLPPTTGAGPVVPLARDLAEVEVVP